MTLAEYPGLFCTTWYICKIILICKCWHVIMCWKDFRRYTCQSIITWLALTIFGKCWHVIKGWKDFRRYTCQSIITWLVVTIFGKFSAFKRACIMKSCGQSWKEIRNAKPKTKCLWSATTATLQLCVGFFCCTLCALKQEIMKWCRVTLN